MSAVIPLLACAFALLLPATARAAAPVNDAFADAATIAGASTDVTGTTDQATAEAGEPKIDSSITLSPRRTVWYRWTAPADRPVTLTLCNMFSASQQLAVYTGASVAALTRVTSGNPSLASGRCGAGSIGGDAVDFAAKAGTTYRIAVEATQSYAASFTLSLNPVPVNDALAGAITLSSGAQVNTALATQELGEPDHGGGMLSAGSVWYAVPVTYSTGLRRLSTCDSDFDTALAVYARNGIGFSALTLVAGSDDSDACGPGSKQSSVAFTPQPGVSYVVAVAGHGDASGIARIAFAPTGDDLANTFSNEFYDQQSGTTVGATRQATETMFGGRGRHSVWAAFTNYGEDHTVILSTCTGDTDTLLGVYTGGADGNPSSLVTVAENDDTAGCGNGGKGSRVRFTALSETRYVVLVDSPAGAAGPFTLVNTSNDDLASPAYGWSDGSGTPVNNGGAGADAGEAAHGGQAASHSVWYTVFAGRTATYTFDTCDTQFDTTLSVYRSSSADPSPGSAASLTSAGENDDSATCNSNGGSRVAIRNTGPTTYYVAVDGHAGATGAATLNIISNDDRADALPLTWPLTSYSQQAWTGGATVEPGEPDHAAQGSPHSAWFTFTPTADQRVALQGSVYCMSLGGAVVPPIVAVYTKDDSGTLVSAGSAVAATGCGSSARVVLAAHAGTQYWVAIAVKGTAGGRLYLSATGPPANDDFATPAVLPADATTLVSSATNELASKQAGEPDHAGDAGGGSLWWSYKPAADEHVVLNICNNLYTPGSSPLDSVIAVYEGTTLATLKAVAANDDGTGPGCVYGGQTDKGSRVAFDVKAGREYRIAVDGKGGTRGAFYLQRAGVPSNDARLAALSLGAFGGYTYGTTELATAEAGEPAHAGSPAAHSVWYQVTPSSAGTFLAGTCRRSTAPMRVAVYHIVGGVLTPLVSGGPSAGCAGGLGARVRVTATAFDALYIAVDASGPTTGDFTFGFDIAPANDTLAAAVSLYDYNSNWTSFDATQATREEGEPDHGGAGGAGSLWYTWTTMTAGAVQFDTCDVAGYDTALAVYTQTSTGMGGLHEVAANDDATGCGDGHASRLHFDAEVGKTYYIAVDGHGGAAGTGRLTEWRAPYNDNMANAWDYGSDISTSGSTRLATAEAGESNHAGSAAAASVWYKLSGRGRWVIDTCGSSFDTRLAVYRGTDAQHLTPVASNDDAAGCGVGGSRVTFTANTTGAERLWVAVDGKSGATGDFVLAASPSNDDFASAMPVLGDRTMSSAYLSRATAEAGEPGHDGGAATHSVWYRWQPQRTGPAVVRACSAGMRAGVYTGQAVGSLTPVVGAVTHAVPVVGPSSSTTAPSTTAPPSAPPAPGGGPANACGGTAISFTATAGVSYVIALDAAVTTVPSTDLSPYAGYATVLIALAPINDNRASATIVPTGGGTFTGYDEAATREQGEPDHAGADGAHSVWYRWTPGVARSVTVNACGSSYDTAVAVYTEGSGGALTEVAHDDDGAPSSCWSRTSRLRFRASAALTYWIAVDGHGGDSGPFNLELAPAPANDDLAAAQDATAGSVLMATTRNATAEDAEPAHGGQGGASVWYRFTAPRTGTAAFSTCGSATDTLLAAYTGTSTATLHPVATGDDDVRCGVGNHGSRITVAIVKDTKYLIAVDAKGGEGGTFTLRVDPPANDDFEDATVLPASASAGGSYGSAGIQPGEPSAGSAPSVWYRWTAPATATVEVNTCGSYTTPVLYTGDALATLVTQPVSTPATRSCSSGGSIVQIAAIKDRTYAIQVTGYGEHRLQVAPPANDRVGGAQTLSGQHASAAGTTVGASQESGDPWVGSGHAVWYRWTASDAGVALLDACASDVPTTLTVFRSSDDTYTQVLDVGDAAGCALGAKGSQTTFQTVKDAVYYLAVDTGDGAAGAFTLVLDANVDTAPPETTLTTRPSTPTNAYSLSFAFTSDEAGSTFECALDTGDYATCATPHALLGVAEGAHTFRVRARDKAGNVDVTPAAYTFTIDRTPPVAKMDQSPPALGRATSASFEFSANETGATFTCSLDDASPAVCASPQSRTGLDDGTHSFAIVPKDLAGNVGTTVTTTFRVDTTPPVTTLGVGPDDPTRETTVSQAFEADEPATYQCALDAGAYAACTSPWSTSGLVDGPHAIYMRATDTAGNVEAPAVFRSFTIDTNAPETTIVAAPPALVKDIPSLTFTASEEGSTFECELDAEAWEACGASWSPSALTDGAHTVSVRAVDAAGNVDATVATVTFTYDSTPPIVTLDTVPGAHITDATATVEFHADEAGSAFECETDNEGFAPCASPWTTGSLTEGAHVLSLRATDLAGNTGTEVLAMTVVDRSEPETTIDGHPDVITNAAEPQLTFHASEPGTFECRVDDATFTACSSPTALTDLPEGLHTFSVYARDDAGNVDATPAAYSFAIDRTPPDTTILEAPTAPVHRDEGRFAYSSTDDGHIECQIDDGAWQDCTGSTTPWRMPVLPPGSHVLHVRGVDAAGNADPTPAQATFTVIDVAPTLTLDVSPDAGEAPLDVTADLQGADADDDPLTYTVDYGDGSQDSGAGSGHETVQHRYAKAGTYVLRAEVSDGSVATVRTHVVHVAPGEPLDARAGDDRTAAAGTAVRFDGGDSRPQAGIDGVHWDFGDGGSAGTVVAEHVYAAAGTYTATLTVTLDGTSKTDTVTVVVLPDTAPALDVTVTSGGTVLSGADVAVIAPDGTRVAGVSGADGLAKLRGLADGSYSVAAYAPGYLPARASADVAAGHGAVTIALTPGELAKVDMTSHPMTRDEILAAGIDPNDPANQHVFEFNVELAVKDPATPSSGGSGGGGGYFGWGGGGWHFIGGGHGLSCLPLICRATVGGAAVYLTPQVIEGQPMLAAMVIPFRVKWLKEFFDISMTVHNLADPSFTFTHGVATIDVPNGLSLAPTRVPQHQTVQMPDIRGGSQATAHWILRGDVEGSYDVGATYGAVLDPIGRSFTLRGTLEDPLKVWGGSALKLTVDVDDTVADGHPYAVKVGLKNVADVPVYNPSVELLEAGRNGYIEQPRQQDEFVADQIAPGDTFWAGPFVLVPSVTGTIDLSHSLLRKVAGDVDLDRTLVTHVRTPAIADDPRFTATKPPLGKRVALKWDAIPGATKYELFRTTDRLTDFPDESFTTTAGTSTLVDAALLDGEGAIAVGSVVDGQLRMRHPIVTGSGTLPDSCSSSGLSDDGFTWTGPTPTLGPPNCSDITIPTKVTWNVGSDAGPVTLTWEASGIQPDCTPSSAPGGIANLTCSFSATKRGDGGTMQVVATDGTNASIRRYTVRTRDPLGYRFENLGTADGKKQGFASIAGLKQSDVLTDDVLKRTFPDLAHDVPAGDTLSSLRETLYTGSVDGTCFGMALTGARFDVGADALADPSQARTASTWAVTDEYLLPAPDSKGGPRPAYTREVLQHLMGAFITQLDRVRQ